MCNSSGRSPKLSDHEWFAQVTHQKWATISESLGSLTKNEGVSELLVFWANQSFAHFFRIKRAIRSENRWANSQPCCIMPRDLRFCKKNSSGPPRMSKRNVVEWSFDFTEIFEFRENFEVSTTVSVTLRIVQNILLLTPVPGNHSTTEPAFSHF